MSDKQRKIVVVIGKTGYGKSYFVQHELLPYLDRIVIFDVMGEYDLDGYIIIDDVGTLREHLKDCLEKTMYCVCRLTSQDDYEIAFKMCQIASGVTVVIEEISNFASPYYMTPYLEQLIRFGRHTSTSVIGITQRVCDVGPLFLNNSDLLVCFQLTDRNDIDRLRSINYVGDNADQVCTLGRYQSKLFFNT